MTPAFDPYHKWLGIPKDQRPPTLYQLLGVQRGESDLEVIDESAVRQTAHVRSYQIGQHAEAATRILNEIAKAKQVLLNPAKRAAYDATLPKMPSVTSSGSMPALNPEMVFDAGSDVVSSKKRKDTPKERKTPSIAKKPSLPLLIGGGVGGLALVAVLAFALMGGSGDPKKGDDKVADNRPPVVKPVQPLVQPEIKPPEVKPVVPEPNPMKPEVKPMPEVKPVVPVDPPMKIPAAAIGEPAAGQDVKGVEIYNEDKNSVIGGSNPIALSPDGSLLAYAPLRFVNALLIRPLDGKGPVRNLRMDDAFSSVRPLTFIAGNKKLVVRVYEKVVGRSRDLVLDLEQNKVVARGELTKPFNIVFDLSPDETKMAGLYVKDDNDPNRFFVRVWSTESGKTITDFNGAAPPIRDLRFSPDGSKVLAIRLDSTAWEYDLATGQERRLEMPKSVMYQHHFTSDGKVIGRPNSFGLTGADLETRNSLFSIPFEPSNFGSSITSSGDARYALVGIGCNPPLNKEEGCAYLVDLKNHKIVFRTPMMPGSSVGHVYLSRNGDVGATISRDGSFRIWRFDVPGGNPMVAAVVPMKDPPMVKDPPTKDPPSKDPPTVKEPDIVTDAKTYKGHTAAVTSLVLTTDGKYLLSGSLDGTIRQWETTGIVKPQIAVKYPSQIVGFSLSPNNAYLAIGSPTGIRVIDAKTYIPVSGFKSERDGLPNFRWEGDDTIIYTSKTSHHRTTFKSFGGSGPWQNSPIRFMIYSPLADYGIALGDRGDNVLFRATPGGGRLNTNINMPNFNAQTAVFSPDSRQVALGGIDKTIKIVDVQGKKELFTLNGHSATVRCLYWAPAADRLISGSDDKTVRIWDTTNGMELQRFALHTGAVFAVVLGNDGKTVFSTGEDRTIRKWAMIEK